MHSIAWVLLAALSLSFSPMADADTPGDDSLTPIVVITDMEPDDRLALHLLVAMYPERIALVGTTVMHSYRKKLLAERLLQQLGKGSIPVVQGSGGYAGDYSDVLSSIAGRQYDLEGKGILSERSLLDAAMQPRSSKKFQSQLRQFLVTNQRVELFVLAPPTDLVAVLDESPELAGHIERLHLMGGWSEVEGVDGGELRSTYNWNMDPQAAKQLLETQNIPIILYSSHVIKESFPGGSMSATSSPQLIALLEESAERLPSINETFFAGSSWDNHLMDRIPHLEAAIGRGNAGKQFSPADPIVIVGASSPEMIQSAFRIRVRLDASDMDPDRGFRVFYAQDKASNVELVDQIDRPLFESRFIDALRSLSLDEVHRP